MNPQDPEALDARLERLERLVEDLQRQLAARADAPAATLEAPPSRARDAVSSAPPVIPGAAAEARRRKARRAGWTARINWDGQLWLNRLGIALVLLGIALLFRYSIEQGWLTPAVRVAIGAAAGAVLFGAGLRLDERRGFGAVLAGGGIAAWYTTGWAAFHLYGLIGYLAAFAGMVGITGLAFGMALRRGSPALGILGAVGGLGTPLILGVSYGTPRGFALYTSLVLAWTAAVHLYRGWRTVLWTAHGFGWVLLFVYARHAPEVRLVPADAWSVQAAVVFAWLALGALPLAKRVVDYRRVQHGHERHWKHLETAHWYALALVPPHAALVVSAAVWHPQPEAWGWWVIAVAGAYAAAAWALYRPDHRIARALLFTASLLLSVGCVAALDGDALLVSFAAQALALHVVAPRGGGVPARWLAHKVFIAAAGWMLFRLVENGDTDAPRVLADLSVLLVGFAAAFLVRSRRERTAYLYFVHAGLLGWVWRGLAPLEGGQGFATIAWCAYGLGLLLLGLKRGSAVLERTGLATLLLVVAKLFLVDLAALHALFRVLLFLGFGSVFLVLSYTLQNWWKDGRPAEGDKRPHAPPAR
ncbi:MAG TPA: DUF2339 domain-containing protein [Longimicrobium sp.]|jgi:uncharacterized membrane protein